MSGTDNALVVRRAVSEDQAAMQEIACCAQAKLTAGGSVQQLEGYDSENVAALIRAGHAHVLTRGGVVIGGVFLEPVTPTCRAYVRAWGVTGPGESLWFLYGLCLHPDWQGQGLGRLLLDRLRQYAIPPPAVLVLDCWAGNAKLRTFYERAGFTPHGVFPEEDYEIAAFTWRSG